MNYAMKELLYLQTMMSDKGYSMYERGELMDNSLREVKGCPSGRLSGSSYIRFTKDIEELKEDFKPFKPLFWGDYELINLYNFEGSVEHFIYIGQKSKCSSTYSPKLGVISIIFQGSP